MDEECASILPEQDDAAKPSGLALPLAAYTLLDDSATKVSIDQSPFGALNCLAQNRILYSLAIGKACEGLGLEDQQSNLSGTFIISYI